MTRPSIVWFRDDLRVADHPALAAAASSGAPLILVFIRDDVSAELRPIGAASRWWLHHSLDSLSSDLASRRGHLILRSGAAREVMRHLVDEMDAGAVFWNRRYGRAAAIDDEIEAELEALGIEVNTFAANLLFEPGTITTDQGTPYRVFTPFWQECLRHPVRTPISAPISLDGPELPTEQLSDWSLLPAAPNWAREFEPVWHPGEQGAHAALEVFANDSLIHYGLRDQPSRAVTSRLSPHLRFGELSPQQIWSRLHRDVSTASRRAVPGFLRELGWREFNWNTLHHFPDLATENLRSEFDVFPWRTDEDALRAWQEGTTGIPLVDAGMRELWRTGYMHNRVRMVVASFLTKNLLIDWRVGESWFWDTLVDADEANNPGNWQWVAGSGADAAPYFRIFNPVLQAERFDPAGQYVDRWVPESERSLAPIVDLKDSRRRALSAYEVVRASRSD